MELVSALAISAAALSFFAIALSIWNTIEVQAQKRATHTVIPIPQAAESPKLEDYLNGVLKTAGADQKDINRNFAKMGLDVDELV
jgi:hypothetical protein